MAKDKQKTAEPQEIAVSVQHVNKSFKLPHEKQNSVKGMVINIFRGSRTYEVQTVLEDISFDIMKGEFFGIVGRNGSGKSTLLKLISQIYTPNAGSITVNGKLTPFIELGVGFNPELTGRENVFLNGALLGFTRKEVTEMYDEIVAFAEIERFMDQKLKNYSSGMQVRLAFSIAIRAQSDVLVLDEVLAVGDEAFQKKCFDYFEQIKAAKQTVILVTHDMRTVEQFCTRALLISEGEITMIGNPTDVATEYSEMNQQQIKKQGHSRQEKEVVGGVTFDLANKTNKGKPFSIGDTMQVEVAWEDESIENAAISILKQSGERMFAVSTFKAGPRKNTKTRKSCAFEVDLQLAPGTYFIRARLMGNSPHKMIKLVNNGPIFDIYAPKNEDNVDGLVRLPYKWL